MLKKFKEFNKLAEGKADSNKIQNKFKAIWDKALTDAEKKTLSEFKKILNKELIGTVPQYSNEPVKKILDVYFWFDPEGTRFLSVEFEDDFGNGDTVTYTIKE